MRDIEAALMEQILDIPQRQRVAEIHHNSQADDFRRRLEVPENAGAAHARKAIDSSSRHKPIFI
jgi:hypothetical protein